MNVWDSSHSLPKTLWTTGAARTLITATGSLRQSVYSRLAGYEDVNDPERLSAYNGHFESTCYHPLLLFNGGEGDCLGAMLRPGNVHIAEGWEEVLLPEIERQQQLGKEV